MSSVEETKYIRNVCPTCLQETRTPNKFWDVIKFWKYETVEEEHTDVKDCIKHLNRRIAELTRTRVSINTCPHCPHCMHHASVK